MIYNWAGGQQQYYGADVIVWDSPYAIIGTLLSEMIYLFIDGYSDPVLRQYGSIRSQTRAKILDGNVAPSIIGAERGGQKPKIQK